MLQRAETPATLAGVDAARAFFATCLDPLRDGEETLWVAHLDEGAHCIHLTSYADAAGQAAPPTRAILTDAAKLRSAGLLLAHRQPGSSQPRLPDRTATHRLALAAEACDISLVDHLVFAGDSCTSMRRIGLL